MVRTGWLLSAAAVLAIGLGQQAQATPMTYSGYSVLNGQTVTLSGPALGGQTLNALAGQITMSNTNTPGGSIATWCVDIAHDLLSSGSFTQAVALTGSLADQANALLSNVLPTLASNVYASAALQVAIWEGEYGSSLTVTTSQAVQNLATTYLNHLSGIGGQWSADPTKTVMYLDGAGVNQSQIYLASTSVPEPATFAVLAAGLVGLGLVRRRQAAPAT